MQQISRYCNIEINSHCRSTLWSYAVIISVSFLCIYSCSKSATDSNAVTSQKDSGVCDGNDCSDADAVDSKAPQEHGPDAISSDITCRTDEECGNGPYCWNEKTLIVPTCKPYVDNVDGGYCDITKIKCNVHCHEEFQQCDCDEDGDGFLKKRCGGNPWDCDDGNNNVNPGETEKCDHKGIDYDCNPETIVDPNGDDEEYSDSDGDGYVSKECCNRDPETLEIVKEGPDCNDGANTVNPAASEYCDYIDNDCDGYTDNHEDEKKHGTLLRSFFPDRDGDLFGDKEGMILSCIKPVGYVERSEGDTESDCNDNDKSINPSHLEICDCKDNDCDEDGSIDEEPLVDKPTFHNTIVKCDPDLCGWVIEKCPEGWLHCDDSLDKGCETPANALSSCRECLTNCLFSCGSEGCDEIDMLSVGAYHACAVTAEGNAACWGRNGSGQLGIDSDSISLIPSPVIVISNIKGVSAGEFHTCAIVGEDNILYCWGSNKFGQLAMSLDIEKMEVPNTTLGRNGEPYMSQVKSVAAGYQHTCIVNTDGGVACWGNQRDGRLGNGIDSDIDLEENVPSPVIDSEWDYVTNGVQVVSGLSHSCLLTQEGKIMCWGDNSSGQLGIDGVVDEPYLAQELLELTDLVQGEDGEQKITFLTAGLLHTCALSSSGKVYCWGGNLNLQLGRTAEDVPIVPREVSGLSDVVTIAAGKYHTCAQTRLGELMCWGSNQYGERGDSDPAQNAQPQIVAIEPVDWIAAGGNVSCARTWLGQVMCWGNNFFGQLGNGDVSGDFQPNAQEMHNLEGSIL